MMEYEVLGTKTFEKSNTIQLFNSETQLNITITDAKLDATTIRIYDLKGGHLISKTSTEQKFSLNISSLTQGIYVSTIERGNKRISQKFIKK